MHLCLAYDPRVQAQVIVGAVMGSAMACAWMALGAVGKPRPKR